MSPSHACGGSVSHNRAVGSDLDRFLIAQQDVYEGVIDELRRGHKTGHWIWFIFPQLSGLGRSETSRYYAISSLQEAREYLAHPVLGARLRECAGLVLSSSASTAVETFGSIDAVKFRSSMTLFHRAAPDEPVFTEVLVRYYGGVPDEATDVLLG